MMAAVDVTVTVSTDGISRKARQICRNDKLGLYAALETARNVEKYVPRREGKLRESATITPFVIIYKVPYAYKQWMGRNIGKRTTPGTVSHWETMANVREIAKAVTEYARRL